MSGAGGGRRAACAPGRPAPGGRGGMNDGPQIGIGEVRHRRLRPAANAFAYPTYFLLLPMRACARSPTALARNRFGLLASTTATMATAATTRWPGSTNCWREGVPTPTARSGCTPTRACWAMSSSRSASGTATAATAAGGHRRRGQQHLRRAALLPAGRARPGLGPRAAARKVFHVSPFCACRALPLPLHAHGRAHGGAHRPRRRRRPAAADQRQRPNCSR
jgi:hypothetical protein